MLAGVAADAEGADVIAPGSALSASVGSVGDSGDTGDPGDPGQRRAAAVDLHHRHAGNRDAGSDRS